MSLKSIIIIYYKTTPCTTTILCDIKAKAEVSLLYILVYTHVAHNQYMLLTINRLVPVDN